MTEPVSAISRLPKRGGLAESAVEKIAFSSEGATWAEASRSKIWELDDKNLSLAIKCPKGILLCICLFLVNLARLSTALHFCGKSVNRCAHSNYQSFV